MIRAAKANVGHFFIAVLISAAIMVAHDYLASLQQPNLEAKSCSQDGM